MQELLHSFILDKQKFLTFARNIILQSTIVTTCLVNVSEDMSEIVSLEIALTKPLPEISLK